MIRSIQIRGKTHPRVKTQPKIRYVRVSQRKISCRKIKGFSYIEWKTPLATPQRDESPRRFVDIMFPKQKPITPSTMTLFVRGRLFGEYGPTLCKSKHRNGGRSFYPHPVHGPNINAALLSVSRQRDGEGSFTL